MSDVRMRADSDGSLSMGSLQALMARYLGGVWRRRWLALAVAAILCVVGWTAVMLLPDRYQASTRLYVDTQTLLSPLLKGIAVDVNVGEQVSTMQRTLLSRPNIESVLRMTDLDVRAVTPEQREAIINSITSRVSITAESKNLFRVSFTDPDPALAKRVVQSLLTIFVESNMGASRRDMEQARRFIDGQLAAYEQQLKAAENRLVDFKQKNARYLLESGRSFAGALDQARTQLRTIKTELDDALIRRDALAKQLQSIPGTLEVSTAPQVVVQGAQRPMPTALEQRISEVEKNLDGLLMRFTAQHPDVLAARRQLAALKQQQESEAKTEASVAPQPQARASTQRVSNPVYEQVKLKLVEADSTVQMLERRYNEQQVEVTQFEVLAKTAPAVEAEMLALDRDYKVVQKNYNELLERRESAKLAQEVEAKADKVQFRVIDPPEAASKPSFPNRPLFLSGVLVLALGAGVALALGLTLLDDSFSSSTMLSRAFGVPVLGSVSEIVSSADRRRRLRWTVVFGAACGVLVVCYGAMLMYALGVISTLPLRS